MLSVSTITVGLLLSLSALGAAQDATTPPPELGKIAWSRDLDSALASAKTSQKPVMVVFQEIPG